MSTSTVETIIRQIDELSEVDRQQLQSLLDERAECEWQQLAAIARTSAEARGVGQPQIDAAVERLRYQP